jgi:hypothetical protein
MYRLSILSFFLVISILKVYSQDKLNGRVYEDKTKVLLGNVKIEDLKSHITAITDSTGKFSIKASTGDFLTFTGFAYITDTVYVANLKYLEVYLKPKQNMLDEVKIQNVQTRTGKLSAVPITGVLGSRKILYQTDEYGNQKGGVKLMVFDSNGDAKKKKRDGDIADNEEKQLVIYNTFQPKNLQNYLPLKGVEMDNFIILYTPDVATYYDASFNLTSYLNISYKKFLLIPANQRTSTTAFKLVTKPDTLKN